MQFCEQEDSTLYIRRSVLFSMTKSRD